MHIVGCQMGSDTRIPRPFLLVPSVVCLQKMMSREVGVRWDEHSGDLVPCCDDFGMVRSGILAVHSLTSPKQLLPRNRWRSRVSVCSGDSGTKSSPAFLWCKGYLPARCALNWRGSASSQTLTPAGILDCGKILSVFSFFSFTSHFLRLCFGDL